MVIKDGITFKYIDYLQSCKLFFISIIQVICFFSWTLNDRLEFLNFFFWKFIENIVWNYVKKCEMKLKSFVDFYKSNFLIMRN